MLERTVRAPVLAQHRWVVTAEGSKLSVRLETSAGALVKERVLKAPTACAERARVAGAVLATWMMEQPAAVEPPVVEPPAVEPAPPIVTPAPIVRPAAAPVFVSAVDAGTVAAVEPTPRPTTPPLVSAPPRESPVPSLTSGGASSAAPTATSTKQRAGDGSTGEAMPWSWSLSGELRAHASGSMTGGLGVRLGGGTTFGGFLELNAVLPRTLAFGAGDVTWNRFGAALGARYHPDWRRVLLEPAVSLEVAALWARASGFVRNEAQVTPDVAACAHLRAGVHLEAVTVFTGAKACWWPIQTNVQVGGVSGMLALPSFEASAVLGLGFEWVKGSSEPGLSGS